MRHAFAAQRGQEVVDRHVRHRRARGGRGADAVDDGRPGRAQERVVGRQRLGIGDVQRGAADLGVRASTSASVSTTSPRAVLTSSVRLHQRELAGADQAAGSVGQRRVERRSRIAGAARRAESRACAARSSRTPRRAADGLADAAPADHPERRAVDVDTQQHVGLERPLPRPHRVAVADPPGTAMSSAQARSAVVSVRTSGVLPTGMPRLVAASRSTLSVPTA